MGSGCNNSSSGNFFEKLTPDTGVLYTGQPIPALGICTGDRLNEVEAVLLQKIIDYSTGVGISIPNIDLSTCDAFKDCIVGCCSACTDLPCLLECYKNTICTIWGDVETLKDDVNTLLNGPYNALCLSGITSVSTLNQIIQQLIDEFCALKTAFGVLQTSVNGFVSGINTTIGQFLTNSIKTCQGSSAINVLNPGTASVQFNFQGFVPIGGIIPWAGNTTDKFDTTGKGRPGTDWCGWAICNGQNGTPNMVGRVPMMATNIAGAIPPSGYNFPYNTTGGEYAHTLTGPESGVAAHGHGVNDPGHDHFLRFKNWKFNRNGGGGSGGDNYTDLTGGPGTTSPDYTATVGAAGFITDGTPVAGRIGKSGTGISINNSGPVNAQNAHNNVQPYIALYYIQRIS
jgi:microcystin-dependent protein